jgi:hypothetical protein
MFEGSIDLDACSKLNAFLRFCCKIYGNLHFFVLVLLSSTYFSTVYSCPPMDHDRDPARCSNCPTIARDLSRQHSTHFFVSDRNKSPELVPSFVLIIREFIRVGFFVHELLKFYSINAVISVIHSPSDSHSSNL